MKKESALKIRKIHRYLGLFLGIQFLMWTISGLFFSWTDIDEIHGDQFRNGHPVTSNFDGLIYPPEIEKAGPISSLELRDIAGEPYYWINKEQLFHAKTGSIKLGITADEARQVAEKHMVAGLRIKDIERITKVGKHHEYRGRTLPAYVISYETPENIKAYVAEKDGSFQTLRHRNWRWFDFLWMTHTMDYQGRDDFNTVVLRAFSLLGLITVLSGFLLWSISSPSIRKARRKLGLR